jgi:arylsulfatase A-like enzyme
VSGTPRERGWNALLWALALTLPVGAFLQPWLFPSRSDMPVVARRLIAPVILITVPGLRADHVTHLGYDRPTTPGLDRLAAQGVSVLGFSTNSNDAVATIGTVFSGSCPEQSGLRGSGDRLPDRVVTLAEHLRSAGLSTAAVLSDPALIDANLVQGFATVALDEGARAELLLDEALRLIRKELPLPYFVWIDLSDLTAPYGGPGTDISRFAPDAPPGFGDDLADYDLDPAEMSARGWGRRELDWMVARYDAALVEVDAAIARFTQALADDNELEMLTLCVMGSRGARLDDRPGRLFTHGVDLYQFSLHVPLILRLPSQHVRGLRLARREQSVDVGVMLADIGARRPWTAPQGRSFTQDILFRTESRPAVFAEGLVQPVADQPATRRYALRAKGWKLISNGDGSRPEVYQLSVDPGERSAVSLPPIQLEALQAHWGEWAGACLPR